MSRNPMRKSEETTAKNDPHRPPSCVGPEPIVADLGRRLGRPLRVLHIGNIANNAYNNAKIQRRFGIEADVMSVDCYHVMSTPEWEDGGLQGLVDDPEFPDWWATNLKGFRRPEWFASGRAMPLLAYFFARRSGSKEGLEEARRRLERQYMRVLDSRAMDLGSDRAGTSFGPEKPTVERFALFDTGWPRAGLVIDASKARLQAGKDNFRRGLASAFAIERRGDMLDRLPDGIVWITRIVLPGVAQRIEADRATAAVKGFRGKTSRSRLALAGRIAQNALALAGHVVTHAVLSSAVRIWSALRGSTTGGDVGRRAERPEVLRGLINEFSSHNSALSKARLSRECRVLSEFAGQEWAEVLGSYDIVQGYALDGLYPLMNGVDAFASYEHGTIRVIPFQDTAQGRLCRFAYQNSPLIFVTNTDVLPAIDRLGIDRDRVVCLPHAFDNTKLTDFADQNSQFQPSREGGPVFFCPTRHHWKHGDGSWLKGNDRLLRAAAILHRQGHSFRLILTRWGKEVDLSQALIDELGCGDVITWVNPVGKQGLWQRYLEADAVLDQFVLPAIGGVAFETLTLGRRLITAMDADVMTEFFGRAPPILAAQSVDDVVERMHSVIADPADQAGLGAAGTQWIEDYHSARRTVQLQVEAYSRLLAAVEDRPAA